jgi:flagellar hook-associated protein 2
VITDTSGQSASHLVIADVGGGTTASDLKIAVDGAVNSVASGALGLQSVSEATSLSKYGPNGAAVPSGSFSITNSAGATAIINVTSAVKTIGDVIDRINAAGINVTARLNDTGDGFVLVDDSGGSGTLKVQDIGGAPAAALRLTGAATTGSDGKQRINSRLAAVVQISATDTLMSVSAKINSAGGSVKASVVDSGAAVNPFRLSLTSTIAGRAGRLIVDDGNLGLNFTDQSIGQDAVLRIGSDPATAFLKTSSTNSFQDAVTGYNVTLLKPGTEPAVATGSLNTDSLQSTLTTFVTNYNSMVDQIATLTKYDATTQTRGPLQGNATVLQIPSRILSLVNRIVGTTDAPIRSLADVGLTVIAGGKLRFDPSRFQQAISDHPQDVTQLFLDKDTGFGVKLDALLKDLTDDHTGSLTAAAKAFDDTASQIQDQIDRATSTMNARQAYLENQFNNMEAILSTLQSQQTTLTALSSLITGVSTARSSK